MGYAEADPTSDVEGHDAAYKLAILASLAFETHVAVERGLLRGDHKVTPEDMAYADELGYVIKLLAIAKRTADAHRSPGASRRMSERASPGRRQRRVQRHLHRGRRRGRADVLRPGAGSFRRPAPSWPTSWRRRKTSAGASTAWLNGEADGASASSRRWEVVSRYYVHAKVVDSPGVLAQIAQAFGDHDVSIESVIQKGKEKTR